MKTFSVKALVLALGLTAFATINAQAETIATTPDSNPSAFAEQYQFSSNPIALASFSDIINLEITPYRDLVATLSGTSDTGIKFTSFNLYSGSSTGVNSLVATGDVFSPIAKLSFGYLTSDALAGGYFLKVMGTQSGISSYNGNITLTAAVPEPESYAMMLAGLGLMGVIARRRRIG
ncbi:MAG TPA: FxDxF family PEP-CTERM protein [Methylophilaceae bacterium]|nr:FxDxF family PEP-CTERM protein [Methylophilaceae bacterium]